jgi:hypothetical protein
MPDVPFTHAHCAAPVLVVVHLAPFIHGLFDEHDLGPLTNEQQTNIIDEFDC